MSIYYLADKAICGKQLATSQIALFGGILEHWVGTLYIFPLIDAMHIFSRENTITNIIILTTSLNFLDQPIDGP